MGIRFSHILTLVFLITSLNGCIKNNNLDLQNPGVGFPKAANSKNEIIIRPETTPQQVSGILLVNLASSSPATSDIHVAIADNSTAMVNAYNAANGTSIHALPRSLWSIPSELVIKAGDRFAMADITINNTSGINLNQQYAIGITMTGASGGNKIADNLKNLFIVLRIQNILDGKYSMKGQFYHPQIEPNFASHNFVVELHTNSPYSADLYWPLYGGYYTPITSGGVPTCCFIEQRLSFSIISVTTNEILAWNSCASCSGIYWPISLYNNNTYNNRWDPATKTIYAAFGYNLGPNNSIIPGQSRAWIDTLTYLGPR